VVTAPPDRRVAGIEPWSCLPSPAPITTTRPTNDWWKKEKKTLFKNKIITSKKSFF
jgi:hypothetical protein